MILDSVYVDMNQGLVLGLKPKPEFLLLFNLGEPVTTGDWGDGVESNRPATNFLGISVDSNRFNCLGE